MSYGFFALLRMTIMRMDSSYPTEYSVVHWEWQHSSQNDDTV